MRIPDYRGRVWVGVVTGWYGLGCSFFTFWFLSSVSNTIKPDNYRFFPGITEQPSTENSKNLENGCSCLIWDQRVTLQLSGFYCNRLYPVVAYSWYCVNNTSAS